MLSPMVIAPFLMMLAAPAPEVSVRWSAPRSCPTTAELQAQVEAVVAPGARGHAQAEVVAHEGSYRLSLVVDTPHGRVERSVDGSSCEAVASAAAVMIAVAADPIPSAEGEVPTPPPEPNALVVAPATTVPEVRLEPVARVDIGDSAPRSPRRPHTWIVELVGGAAVGVVPRPHGLARVAVGPRWSRLEVLVTGSHRFSREVTHAQGGGAAIFVSSAGVAAGPIVRWGRASMQLRVGVEGGAMVAVGRGLDDTRTATSPWVGARAEPGVAVAVVPWLALSASAACTVAVTRPQFAIDDGRVLYKTPAVGALATLGLQFRIPVRQSVGIRGPRR